MPPRVLYHLWELVVMARVSKGPGDRFARPSQAIGALLAFPWDYARLGSECTHSVR